MNDSVLRDPRETELSKRAERLQSRAEKVVHSTPFLPGEAKGLITEMAAVITALAKRQDDITPYLDEAS